MWRRSLILEHMRGVNSREKTCLSFTVQEAAVEQASIQIADEKTLLCELRKEPDGINFGQLHNYKIVTLSISTFDIYCQNFT